MGTAEFRNGLYSLRIGGAVLLVVGVATISHAGPAKAGSCLYPDKATGAEPNYACLTPKERTLVDLRRFRAEMTVAALRCGQQKLYNTVVTRHQNELSARGRDLGKAFRRLHGAAATRELNRFVTHLTNRASIKSLGIRDYCRSMSEVLAEAAGTPLRQFAAFVGGKPLARVLAGSTAPVRAGDAVAQAQRSE